MRKLLLLPLLLLPFMFLLTVNVSGSKAAFSLNQVRSLPTLGKSYVSPINSSLRSQTDESQEITPDLRFGVISDTHVKSTDPVTQNKFQQMLIDMEKLKVPNLVINGDLGDGLPQDYDTLEKLIKRKNNRPALYYTIGNHEFYKAYHNPITNAWSPETFPNGETNEAALGRFLDFTKRSKVYYDEYLNSYHFIFLGSEKSAMTDPAYGDRAYLSEEQLGWLESKLRENHTPGKPIFVFLHQPLLRLGSTLSKPDFVIQADRLREILNHFPEVIFFSGHIHRQLKLSTTILKQEFTMVNSSSVALPRDANGQALPNQSEGLVVEVVRNKVIIKGRDFLTKNWIQVSL
ncbi:metallophosphoesterase [Desulfosporosinus sp. BICA1-9]|uniref:metallophosphoesterase family protein n=1 Tax=Desulfosporosinus sp. BICA1-9 TaxID=1531958 RepID=UPI000B1CE334|nr:metallophosphoesterase [Desulfosporosinus sp. BICA1-9]HBW36111.1 metallophosphoesterase [Desulfosporosinus sp.]